MTHNLSDIKSNRDPSIDILRGIGLLLVVLAHVGPDLGTLIYEIRTFDVVLMVFVSGLTFSVKSDFNYLEYLCTRTARLIVPTYIFLTGYFIVSWIITGSLHTSHTIFLSYTLIGGIGYVWIIRIFLLVMIIAPWLYRLATKLNLLWFTFAIIFMLGMCDILVLSSHQFPLPLQRVTELFLIPAVGYSVPYSIAIRIKKTSNNYRLYITLTLALLLAVCYYHFSGESLLIHLYKAPPRSIYLCYGIIMSVVTFFLLRYKQLNIKALQWGGQNTMWIYFWHIPFVDISRQFGVYDKKRPKSLVTRLFFVF